MTLLVKTHHFICGIEVTRPDNSLITFYTDKVSVRAGLTNSHRADTVNTGKAMISDQDFCCHRNVKQQMENPSSYLNHAAVIGKISTVGLA